MRQKPKPLSRKALADITNDLAKRLDDQVLVMEAIVNAERPLGAHIVLEHRVRTVFGILLQSQLKQLQDAEQLARLIADSA